MLQCRFIDGLFDPALQQLLRLHARTDDFVTTVAKAKQYVDAQEQAKITAISKKPNVRFAAVEDPSPDRTNPYLMVFRRSYRESWTTRAIHQWCMSGNRYQETEDPRKARVKKTMHSHQLLVMPLPVR